MEFRMLQREEMKRLCEIDRQEIVKGRYIEVQNGLRLETFPLQIDGWQQADLEAYILKIEDIHMHDGFVMGAFDGDKLVGMGALDCQYISGFRLNLDKLYVDASYRGKGVGTVLLQEMIQHARSLKAEALYISATPFQQTVDFYRAKGAQLAQKKDAYLFQLEPEDIHLEIKI